MRRKSSMTTCLLPLSFMGMRWIHMDHSTSVVFTCVTSSLIFLPEARHCFSCCDEPFATSRSQLHLLSTERKHLDQPRHLLLLTPARMTLREILSATGAGCATTIVGHPLDSIKVHLQTNPSLRNTRAATASLYAQNALLRGMGPPLANAILMNTIMFSVFSTVKCSIAGKEENSMSAALIAGTISGFATACIISTPTDYIKIQSQLRGVSSLKVLQQSGFSLPILFRGHVPNLCREGVFTMAYLGLYDQAKADAFWQIALVSSLTGGLAWIISYPFDTVKSIVQSIPPDDQRRRLSLLSTTCKLWNQGGMNAFYRGCGASTGRAMMVTSLRMIAYEFIMKLFRE